jgi:hypothetical protein
MDDDENSESELADTFLFFMIIKSVPVPQILHCTVPGTAAVVRSPLPGNSAAASNWIYDMLCTIATREQKGEGGLDDRRSRMLKFFALILSVSVSFRAKID